MSAGEPLTGQPEPGSTVCLVREPERAFLVVGPHVSLPSVVMLARPDTSRRRAGALVVAAAYPWGMLTARPA